MPDPTAHMSPEEAASYTKALRRIEECWKSDETTLDLSELRLSILPPEIGKLTALKVLYLDCNHLATLPPEIGFLTKLTKLSVSSNQLTSLPPEIGELSALDVLNLQCNHLTSLPPEIGKLTALFEISLYNNHLEALPSEIGQAQGLVRLYASNNKLASLPAEIGRLTELERLYLDNNNLRTLPGEIGGLKSLRKFYLSGNDLTTLPSEMGQLKELWIFYINGNPLQSLPQEVVFLLDPRELDAEHLIIWGTSKLAPKRTWLFRSTHETAAAGSFTLLAMAESLAAVSILVWLGQHTNPLPWLTGAIALAPLSLLRTPGSMALGVKWYRKFENETTSLRISVISSLVCCASLIWKFGWWATLIVLLPGIMAALAMAPPFLLLRIGASIVSFVRHPVQSMAAIPGNWRRIVLATDSFTEPEYLPGVMTIKKGNRWELLRDIVFGPMGPLSALKWDDSKSWYYRWFCWTAVPFLYLTTAAYRWSVKATCVIYLPLIWLIRKGSFLPRKSMHLELQYYINDEARWLQFAWSLVVLLALAVKVIWVGVMLWMLDLFKGNVFHGIAMKFISPHEIPLWQIASACNALLGFGIWYYARKMNRRHELQDPPEEATVILWWRILGSLSVFLTLYTISCTVAIVWGEGSDDFTKLLHELWGKVGGKWFPG